MCLVHLKMKFSSRSAEGVLLTCCHLKLSGNSLTHPSNTFLREIISIAKALFAHLLRNAPLTSLNYISFIRQMKYEYLISVFLFL